MIRSAAVMLFCLFCLATFSAAKADNTEIPLETCTKAMSKAYKDLLLDLQHPKDSDKSAYLALAGILKTEAKNERNLVPKKAAGLPAGQKNAALMEYHNNVDHLSASIDALILAIKESQWNAADKQMETIKQEIFDGHKESLKKK